MWTFLVRWAALSFVFVTVVGCTLLEAPQPPADEFLPLEVEVSVLGALDDERIAPNAQFEFGHASEVLSAQLFEGDLSDRQVSTVRSGELTQVLVERAVAAYRVKRRLIPQVSLLPYARYTLVTARSSLVFEIGEHTGPRLVLRWPVEPAGTVVLCSVAGNVPFRPVADINLYPVGSRARWVPLGNDCAALALLGAQALDRVALPIQFGDWAVDPVVLQPRAVEEEQARSSCPLGAWKLGPGCARLFDNALLVLPPVTPTLWQFVGDFHCTHWTETDTPFAVEGLSPLSTYEVQLQAFDSTGRIYESRPSLFTSGATQRPLIAGVLADPVGSEAQGEWVQLLNAGALPVNLEGWQLLGSGAPVVLPEYELMPGESILLVSEEFDWSEHHSSRDSLSLLRVRRLTSGGLSNTGESLQLLTPSNVEVSRFPSLVSLVAGTSWTRTFALAPDERQDSFVQGEAVPSLFRATTCDARSTSADRHAGDPKGW